MKTYRKQLRIAFLLLILFCLLPMDAQAASADLYYGRNALAELDNAEALLYAYDALAEGVENTAAEITVYDGTHALSQDELKIVMEAYTGDHAGHFWLGTSYGIGYNSRTVLSVHPTYLLSGDELTRARAGFEDAIDEILSGIDADWNDFEKELYLHDALAERIEYDYTFAGANIYNAYGALVEGEAVCEGYAEAFQTLLHRAGIESYIVTGRSRGEGHEWNLVRIDGDWYFVDLTWNDQEEELFHAYFNITGDVLTEDHLVDSRIGLPECTAEEWNYFAVMGGWIDSFDAEAIGEQLAENDLTVHLYAEGELTVSELLNGIGSEIRAIAKAAGVRGSFLPSCQYLGREVILCIIPEGLSGTVRRAGEGSLTVTVRGLFDSEPTAELYMAVYDEDGRMIGLERAAAQTLTADGETYTVSFDGDADTVRVFALDGEDTPYANAAELTVK